MAEPPTDGLNFFVPYTFLQWAIGALAAASASIGIWVWNLGSRVERAEARSIEVEKENVKLIAKLERLEEAISELKGYLVNELRDLPSRGFIESQVLQLSERMDGMIDAKLSHRRIARDRRTDAPTAGDRPRAGK